MHTYKIYIYYILAWPNLMGMKQMHPPYFTPVLDVLDYVDVFDFDDFFN